jgi:hypothetical protein
MIDQPQMGARQGQTCIPQSMTRMDSIEYPHDSCLQIARQREAGQSILVYALSTVEHSGVI